MSPSCLGGRDNSGGRVISPRQPSQSTFLRINTGSPNLDNFQRSECHEMPRLRVYTGICIKKAKINFAKPTVIEWPREIQRKRYICTFDYSMRVINNHHKKMNDHHNARFRALWFVGSSASASDSNNIISCLLDHNRRSRKRNRMKPKRSDSSNSDSVELMTPLMTLIFDSSTS